MSLSVNELITVVNKEATFHRETAERLRNDKSDSTQYYRHQYLFQAMQEIKKRLEKEPDLKIEDQYAQDNINYDNDVQEITVSQESVLNFINTIKELSGIDPFDNNMPTQSRIDALIMFIMSDNKQRNSSAIFKEMDDILPNHNFDKKIVERRVYTLANKRNLLEKNDKMRGFCKIRQDLIPSEKIENGKIDVLEF